MRRRVATIEGARDAALIVWAQLREDDMRGLRRLATIDRRTPSQELALILLAKRLGAPEGAQT